MSSSVLPPADRAPRRARARDGGGDRGAGRARGEAATAEAGPGGDTVPASIWPSSAQGGEPGSTQDAVASFELQPPAQLLAQRRRQAARLALCQPALALRLILAGQAITWLLALAASAGPAAWLRQGSVCGFGTLLGQLSWMSLVCALRHRLPAWPPGQARLLLGALGALAALPAWALPALLGQAAADAWGAGGAMALGAASALALWRWLGQRAEASRPADDRARLAELQSRIRPHFLFNALNTALALVQVDPPRAERVLDDLSALFRVALAETGSAVTVDDEVDLAQRYLAIEQIRYGSRLRVRWDLDPAAAAARLPPLVLQPLVENAVRHGVEPAPEGGQIEVRSRAWRGMVALEVVNTLPPEPGPPGAGVALANIRERLRLLHDLAGRLHTEQRQGRFVARIEVPL